MKEPILDCNWKIVIQVSFKFVKIYILVKKLSYVYWKFIQNLRAWIARPHTPSFLKLF